MHSRVCFYGDQLWSILNVPQDYLSEEKKKGEFIYGHFPPPHPSGMLTPSHFWFACLGVLVGFRNHLRTLSLQSQRRKGRKPECYCPWGEMLYSHTCVKLVAAAVVGIQSGQRDGIQSGQLGSTWCIQ